MRGRLKLQRRRSTVPFTAKQEQLLKELKRSKGELSGQDLHARLRRSSNPMGLATVYRHLRQLQQLGQVRCRHLPSGEALYAPAERDEHHLTCVDCGSTTTLEICPVHGVQLSAAQLGASGPCFTHSSSSGCAISASSVNTPRQPPLLYTPGHQTRPIADSPAHHRQRP